MTHTPEPPPDWSWRADFLNQMADYLEQKAKEIRDEADRYRGLSAQARTLASIGQWR
jgi:hypothetical protein